MKSKHKLLFSVVLGFMSVLSPACKHGTNDGLELYRRYAIKHLVKKLPETTKANFVHD